MNLPIKLISTDFDGTLFAEFESPPIPAELTDLIGELQARGAKWVINTGRDLSSLMESLGRAGIPIQPDFLVLVEREIHRHNNSRYFGLETWNANCSRTHTKLFAGICDDLPHLIEWINERFHVQIYEDSYSPLCLIASDNGDMDAISHYLNDYCRKVPDLTVVRNDVYARFSHAAFNKGSALGEITRQLGLHREQVFAVGDHFNDLPMLSRSYARCLAAPANAIPVVKTTVREQGGYVSAQAHGSGVMEAMKYYLAAR
jgi:hydroxymethylpyrimidine pyrophosphatase-like HAD family hydrolase